MIHNKSDNISLQSLKVNLYSFKVHMFSLPSLKGIQSVCKAGFLYTKHTHRYIGIKMLFSTVLHVPLTNQQTAAFQTISGDFSF